MLRWNIAGAEVILKIRLVDLYNPLWVLIVGNFLRLLLHLHLVIGMAKI